MIVKVLTRHSPSFMQLLRYILQPGKVGGEYPHVITHNLRSTDIQGYLKEFIKNEATRKVSRKDQIYLYHEILSLSKHEKMITTKDTMDAILHKYISLRGLDGMYVATVHEDTEHVHAHIMASGVKFRTGKAHRLSHSDLRELKIQLQEYHKQVFPELTHSIVNHGSGKSILPRQSWNNRKAWTETVRQTVEQCFAQAENKHHFLQLLQQHDLHHYERSGKVQGIITPEGMKVRFRRIDIEMDQLPDPVPELSEDIQTLELIQKTKNVQHMIQPIDQLAFWFFITGGELHHDPETQSYQVISEYGGQLSISKQMYDRIQAIPKMPELEDIKTYKATLRDIQNEMDQNPEDKKHLKSQEKVITKQLEDTVDKVENAFFFDLSIEDELRLIEDISAFNQEATQNEMSPDIEIPEEEFTVLDEHISEMDTLELENDTVDWETDIETDQEDHDYDERDW